MQCAWSVRHQAHRLDSVHNQVYKDLFNLDSIGPNGLYARKKLGTEDGFMAANFRAHEVENLRDHTVHIQPRHPGRGLSDKGANALDDIPCTMASPDNALSGLARFVQIRFGARQPLQASFRIGHDGHQRLVELVSDRGDELAHRGQSRGVHERSLRGAERLLRSPALSDVPEHEHCTGGCALIIYDRRATVIDGYFAAIARKQHRMVGQSKHGSQAHDLSCGILNSLAGLVVRDTKYLRQRSTDGLALWPTRQQFRHRIHESNSSLIICGND